MKLFVIEIKRMNNSVSGCERAGEKECAGKSFRFEISCNMARAVLNFGCADTMPAKYIESHNNNKSNVGRERERVRESEKNDKWQIFGDDSRS